VASNFEEADLAVVEVELGAIAVAEGLAADGLDFAVELELGAVEEFAEDLSFPVELVLIGELLVLAASALFEVTAGRLDTIWGGFDDLIDAGVNKVRLAFPGASLDEIAGHHLGKQVNAAFVTGKASAAIYKLFDSKGL
jgi:hypothetical protein